MNSLLPLLDFNCPENLTKDQIRDYISAVETEMLTMPQTDIPLKHYFSKGVYGREILIPKGTALIGKIHKHQNFNILSSGEVSVLSIDGIMRVKAPFSVVSSPGVKRLIVAHEDAVWTTIHGTDETDIDKIEDQFIAKTYDEVHELSEPGPTELKEVVWRGE